MLIATVALSVACEGCAVETGASPLPEANASAQCSVVRAELATRSIRTFWDWLEDSGTQLTPAQWDEVREHDLVDLVPEEDLPILHPHGSKQVSEATFALLRSGELDLERDFRGWVDAGLYDPGMAAHRRAAQDYLRRMDGDACAATARAAPEVCHVEVELVVTKRSSQPSRTANQSWKASSSDGQGCLRWPDWTESFMENKGQLAMKASTGNRHKNLGWYTSCADCKDCKTWQPGSGEATGTPEGLSMTVGLRAYRVGNCWRHYDVALDSAQMIGKVSDGASVKVSYTEVDSGGCSSGIGRSAHTPFAVAKTSLSCRINGKEYAPITSDHGGVTIAAMQACTTTQQDAGFTIGLIGAAPLVAVNGPTAANNCVDNPTSTTQVIGYRCQPEDHAMKLEKSLVLEPTDLDQDYATKRQQTVSRDTTLYMDLSIGSDDQAPWKVVAQSSYLPHGSAKAAGAAAKLWTGFTRFLKVSLPPATAPCSASATTRTTFQPVGADGKPGEPVTVESRVQLDCRGRAPVLKDGVTIDNTTGVAWTIPAVSEPAD